MPKLVFRLSISPEEMLRYYAGQAKVVRCVAETGQSLQFPASHLRQFIKKDGIHGRFCITFTKEGKFQAIEKLAT